MYSGHVHELTIILEAVASYNIRGFGMPFLGYLDLIMISTY